MKKAIFIVLVLSIIIVLGYVYGKDVLKEEQIDPDVDPAEIIVEEDSPEYAYTYVVETVGYSPDEKNYVGYKVCDNKLSTCSVYGVSNEKISKSVLGGMYEISFDNHEPCSAAAGIQYCKILGDVVVTPL